MIHWVLVLVLVLLVLFVLVLLVGFKDKKGETHICYRQPYLNQCRSEYGGIERQREAVNRQFRTDPAQIEDYRFIGQYFGARYL